MQFGHLVADVNMQSAYRCIRCHANGVDCMESHFNSRRHRRNLANVGYVPLALPLVAPAGVAAAPVSVGVAPAPDSAGEASAPVPAGVAPASVPVGEDAGRGWVGRALRLCQREFLVGDERVGSPDRTGSATIVYSVVADSRAEDAAGADAVGGRGDSAASGRWSSGWHEREGWSSTWHKRKDASAGVDEGCDKRMSLSSAWGSGWGMSAESSGWDRSERSRAWDK